MSVESDFHELSRKQPRERSGLQEAQKKMDGASAAKAIQSSILEMLEEQIGEEWPIETREGLFWLTLQQVGKSGSLKFNGFPEEGGQKFSASFTISVR